MLFVFSTCRELIRTLPMMLHDPTHSEDLDTDLEDHAVDSRCYLVMSRPYCSGEQQAEIDNARPPWLVGNAFRLNQLCG